MEYREVAAWEREANLAFLRSLAHDASMAGDQRTAALTQFKIRKLEVGAATANLEQSASIGSE